MSSTPNKTKKAPNSRARMQKSDKSEKTRNRSSQSDIMANSDMVDSLPPRSYERSRILLGLRNFLCWKELSLVINPKGLVQLLGPSGCGKSTVLESIYFCLYGSLTTNTSSRPQTFGEKSCSVTMEFSEMDLIIHRNRSPNRVIVIDKALLKRIEGETAQQYIDELFGNSSKFRLSCYIVQNAPTLLDLSPGELSSSIKDLVFDGNAEEYARRLKHSIASERVQIKETLDSHNIKRRTSEQLLIEYNEELERISNNLECLLEEHKPVLTEDHQNNLARGDALEFFRERKGQLAKECSDLMSQKTGCTQERIDELKKTKNSLQGRIDTLTEDSKEVLSDSLLDDLKSAQEALSSFLSSYNENERLKSKCEKLKNDIKSLESQRTDEFDEEAHKTLLSSCPVPVGGLAGATNNAEAAKKIMADIMCEDPSIDKCLEYLDNIISTREGELERLRKACSIIKKGPIQGPMICPVCDNSLFIHDGSPFIVDSPKTYMDDLTQIQDLEDEVRQLKEEKVVIETRKKYIALIEKNTEYDQAVNESRARKEEWIRYSTRLKMFNDELRANKDNLCVFRAAGIKKSLSSLFKLIDSYSKHTNPPNQFAFLKKLPRVLLSDRRGILKFVNSDKGRKTLSELNETLMERWNTERVLIRKSQSDKARIDDLLEDIKGIDQELESMKGKEDVSEAIRRVSKELAEIRILYSIAECQQAVNTSKEKCAAKKEEIKTIRDKIGDCLTKQSNVSLLDSLFKRASLLTLQNYIDVLNSNLDKALKEVFDEPIQIEFRLTRSKTVHAKLESGNFSEEEFDLTSIRLQPSITYRGSEYPSARYLSGGEKQRFNLALFYSFSQSTSCPLLLIDEGINNLHQEVNSEILFKVKEWASDRAILVVAHEAVPGIFDHQIDLLEHRKAT